MILSCISILISGRDKVDIAIYPIINEEVDLPFIVFGVGAQTKQPHIIREEGYPVHQLIFCTSGEGMLLVEGESYHIKKDEYFYLRPNVAHEYYGITDCWGTNWVTFDGENVINTMNKLNICMTTGKMIRNKQKIEMVFNKILTSLKNNVPLSGFVASSLLYELFLAFYIERRAEIDASNVQENSLIHTIIEYIDNHFQEQITLDELAQLVGITPQYLCKIFKKSLHIRPFEYLAKKRIQEAKRLLSNGNMPIKDVGRAVGYKDKSYFYVMFKRHEMISPSNFRGLSKEKR